MFRFSTVSILIIIVTAIICITGCQQKPVGTGTQMATTALDPSYPGAAMPGFRMEDPVKTSSGWSFEPSPECPEITPEKHQRAVNLERQQKEALRKALWWMNGREVMSGKRLVLTSSPAIDLAKASDLIVSTEAPDVSHAAVSEDAVVVSANVAGLSGNLAFKPVAFVNANCHWAINADGKPAEGTRKIGDFVLVPVSGAKTITLTNKLIPVPPQKREAGCIYLCGLDEVIFLPAK